MFFFYKHHPFQIWGSSGAYFFPIWASVVLRVVLILWFWNLIKCIFKTKNTLKRQQIFYNNINKLIARRRRNFSKTIDAFYTKYDFLAIFLKNMFQNVCAFGAKSVIGAYYFKLSLMWCLGFKIWGSGWCLAGAYFLTKSEAQWCL